MASTQALAWRYAPDPRILLGLMGPRGPRHERFGQGVIAEEFIEDGQVWMLEANANPFISYGHDYERA